jgi:hypothetical protein
MGEKDYQVLGERRVPVDVICEKKRVKKKTFRWAGPC